MDDKPALLLKAVCDIKEGKELLLDYCVQKGEDGEPIEWLNGKYRPQTNDGLGLGLRPCSDADSAGRIGCIHIMYPFVIIHNKFKF
ncbi:hypothetical protein DPMN_119448 [Dreissena polymorpha]|uniref:SET domain-containing protein n=1 Tax=Dreissena polymorpha TaxID=45954 RepID=A0A9D4GPZ7_DREPO|nr:hypothetical protein DPMN_119448 [Dreissena polymorpha]